MATNVYTTAYSTAAVRRRGLIPTTGRVKETDLIGFLNDATQDYVVPLLVSSREGFLHATEHTTLVNGQTEYAMPKRATVERLVRVALVSSTTATVDTEYRLDRVETARREDGFSGFELVDNTLVLRSVPSGYSVLRVVYFCEPNRLVPLTDCAKVTAKTSTTITIDAQPTTAFTTSDALDFISGTPGFRWRAQDKTPTGVSGTTLTFASGDIPSTLAVGDYLALAGETPIAQVPKSLRPLLEQRAVCLALEALGDGRLPQAQRTLADMEKRLVPMLTSRVQNAPRVILNRSSLGTRIRQLPANFR